MKIAEYYEKHNLPYNSSLYVVHDMIMTIALTVKTMKKAIKHYLECLEIANKLNYRKTTESEMACVEGVSV